MELGIKFELFRPDGTVVYKGILDTRMLGMSAAWDRCHHDVCFEKYGGVIANGLRYLGFRIEPDTIGI